MIAVIPIVGIIMGSVVLFLWIIFNYKTKKVLMEKGLYKPTVFDIEMFSLFSGLLLLPIGLSLMLFFLLKHGLVNGVLAGLIPFSVGLGLILFFVIKIKVFPRRNG
jgi:hypothetical protein